MLKTIQKLSLMAVVLMSAQACSLGSAAPNPGAVNTAIAQTLAAGQTAQPGIPITGGDTSTPAAPPTQAASPTSTTVQVSVSVATNCRTGPSTAYDRQGGLLVGQVAEVIGRSADGTYWVIRNPTRAGQTCWLWAQFATVIGNTGSLPVMTAPPLPTASVTPVPSPAASMTTTPMPGFIASYSGIENCTGTGWWMDIELKNSGSATFQSMALTVTDTVTSSVVPLDADNFTNRNGCDETDTRDSLPAAAIVTVSSSPFNYNPTGHQMRAEITLCSDQGQSGTCTKQSITFKP